MFCLRRWGKALAIVLLAVAVLALDVGAPRAQNGETAEEVFRNLISEPIVQSRCVNCHVADGASGHTRLVFVRRSPEVDYQPLNLRTFENFLAEFDEEGGGGAYILLKIQGALGHGGLEQVRPGSTDFANMQRFLALLGEELSPPPSLTVETLFDTVLMASPRKTLRRAALIFAGRLPTDAEYAAVDGGDETVLRARIRGLMTGPGFHEFLIRASNDRPYTEVLTADYIMANPMAAEGYGASTEFDDPTDIYESKPSRIVSYYRKGEDFASEYDRVIEAERIINRGSLSTDYPHAGSATSPRPPTASARGPGA